MIFQVNSDEFICKGKSSKSLIQWMAIPVAAFFLIFWALEAKYPDDWDEKNREAFEKVEEQKAKGIIPKPNDKTRHDLYKYRQDKKNRQTEKQKASN